MSTGYIWEGIRRRCLVRAMYLSAFVVAVYLGCYIKCSTLFY